MIKMILQTIRAFIDNGWNESMPTTWCTYWFDQSRVLKIDPDELLDIATTIRDDRLAIVEVKRIQAKHKVST
jgi:hypothetical protein